MFLQEWNRALRAMPIAKRKRGLVSGFIVLVINEVIS
jgi:hypothetical protein